MVPTLVPTLSEMKHAARNTPHRIIPEGRSRTAICTVASMAPACLAVAANAPARMDIHTMVISPGRLAPLTST